MAESTQPDLETPGWVRASSTACWAWLNLADWQNQALRCPSVEQQEVLLREAEKRYEHAYTEMAWAVKQEEAGGEERAYTEKFSYQLQTSEEAKIAKFLLEHHAHFHDPHIWDDGAPRALARVILKNACYELVPKEIDFVFPPPRYVYDLEGTIASYLQDMDSRLKNHQPTEDDCIHAGKVVLYLIVRYMRPDLLFKKKA